MDECERNQRFLTTRLSFIRTTPGVAPIDLYANSNELQKKIYAKRFSESDFTSIWSWEFASRIGARKKIIVQFIKELKNDGIIQFLYELHYNFLPITSPVKLQSTKCSNSATTGITVARHQNLTAIRGDIEILVPTGRGVFFEVFQVIINKILTETSAENWIITIYLVFLR